MKLFSIEELATLTAQENTDCVSIYMPLGVLGLDFATLVGTLG